MSVLSVFKKTSVRATNVLTDEMLDDISKANHALTDRHSASMRKSWMGGKVLDKDGKIMPYCAINIGRGFIGMNLESGNFDKIEEAERFYKPYVKEMLYRKWMGYEELPFQFPGNDNAIKWYNEVVTEEHYSGLIPEDKFDACKAARNAYNECKKNDLPTTASLPAVLEDVCVPNDDEIKLIMIAVCKMLDAFKDYIPHYDENKEEIDKCIELVVNSGITLKDIEKIASMVKEPEKVEFKLPESPLSPDATKDEYLAYINKCVELNAHLIPVKEDVVKAVLNVAMKIISEVVEDELNTPEEPVGTVDAEPPVHDDPEELKSSCSAEIKEPDESNVVNFKKGFVEEVTTDGRALRGQDYMSGFEEENKPLISMYPRLQEVIDLASVKGYKVAFTNTRPTGLVNMDIYTPGIQDPQRFIVDPGKIREEYSILLIGGDESTSVFDYVHVPFEQMGIVFDQRIKEEFPMLKNASDVDRAFYHHIQASGIPAEYRGMVKYVMNDFVKAMDAVNADIRFKVDRFEAPETIDFVVKGAGLGKFAKANNAYQDLKVEMRVVSDTEVRFYASGKTSIMFAAAMPQGIIDKYEVVPEKPSSVEKVTGDVITTPPVKPTDKVVKVPETKEHTPAAKETKVPETAATKESTTAKKEKAKAVVSGKKSKRVVETPVGRK